MTQEEFTQLIQGCDPEKFARHELLDDRCYVFDDPAISRVGDYQHFRSEVADLLDINPRSVAIVGSAKFGFSMAPEKFGNQYVHGQSDIDIVLVSENFFSTSWDQLRTGYYYGLPKLRSDYRNQVFTRHLVIKSSATIVSRWLYDLRENLMGLDKIVNAILGLEDKARYRIYCDWKDVELYHAKGIRDLQERLANANA